MVIFCVAVAFRRRPSTSDSIFRPIFMRSAHVFSSFIAKATIDDKLWQKTALPPERQKPLNP
jgi:hypothetical protein